MKRLNPTPRGKRRALGVFERGFTLVEVLVAMIVMGIIGTIIASTIIYALQSTRTAADGIQSEAQLNDAVARLSKDIATADPILFTSTANGWPANTPAANELWTQTVADDKCIRTRYWIDDSVATNRQLMSTTQFYADDECPDPLVPDTTTPGTTKSIVRALNVVDDAGNPTNLFTYYAKNNGVITAPVSRINTPKIARVQLNVGANVTDRPGGVRLVTSAVPRNVDSNEAVTIPPPDCAEINLRATNPPWGTAPVVQWNYTEDAARWTLRRIGPVEYNGPDVVTTPFTGNASSTTPIYTYVDNVGAEPARLSRNITYELTVDYLAGSTTCPPVTIARPPEPFPAPPNMTVSVTPATPNATPAWPAGTNQSTINISWNNNCTWCRHFQVEVRELNPNSFAPTGTWTVLPPGEQPAAGFSSTTYSPGWDRAFEVRVRARLRDNTTYSNVARALTHPQPTTTAGNVLTYRQNRVTWTGGNGPSTDGFAVLRRPVSGGTWTVHQRFPAGTTTGTFAEALDTLAEYRVVAYNNGPRGTVSGGANLDYYGQNTNSITLLQYPAIPSVQVEGTEVMPDGSYRITSGTTPTSTSYQFWEYQRHKNDQTPTTGNRVSLATGASTAITDSTGNPRGSRQYWMTVACNATGCSENVVTPSLGNFDDGYQRPTATTVTMPTQPNINSNTVGTSYTRTGDAGEPSDKFCATNVICTTQVLRNNSQIGSTSNAAPTYNYFGSVVYESPDWGQTYNWTARNCNPGGCSEVSNSLSSLHWPGPMPLESFGQTDEIALRKWSRSNDNGLRTEDGQIYARLARSYGATGNYNVTRTQTGSPFGGTLNRSVPASSDVFVGYNGDSWRYVPGARYTFTTTAAAANGRTRPVTASMQIAPPVLGYSEGVNACRNSITDNADNETFHSGWKSLDRWRQGGYVSSVRPSQAGGGPSNGNYAPANFSGGYYRTEAIGRPYALYGYGGNTGDSNDPSSFYRWTSMLEMFMNWGGSGTYNAYAGTGWFDITRSRGAWAYRTSTNGFSAGNTGANNPTYGGSLSNDEQYIAGDVLDAGAARQFQLYANFASVNIGDFVGARYTQNQISEDGDSGGYDYQCPSTGGSGWKYDQTRFTRAASPGSAGYVDPFSGSPASNGYGARNG